MRLSINIGTRGRPQALAKTLTETLSNIREADTRILVSIDDDDADTIGAKLPQDDRLIYSIKPREDNRGSKSDRVLTEAPADIYMVGHDSTPFLTPGFDSEIVRAASLFPDGIGAVATLMANAAFPAFQAVTQKWVDLVGYIYSHDYPFWFIDHEIDDLARITGRLVFVDVETDNQQHPGKTHRMRDLRFWLDYFDAARFRRRAVAYRIIDALDEPAWRKAMLKTWHHPIEARSLYINHGVRMDADAIEEARGDDSEPDDGYLRMFDQARRALVEMQAEITALHMESV